MNVCREVFGRCERLIDRRMNEYVVAVERVNVAVKFMRKFFKVFVIGKYTFEVIICKNDLSLIVDYNYGMNKFFEYIKFPHTFYYITIFDKIKKFT